MLLKIVYLLTCRVLSLAVLAFRGDPAKDAGLLVLRHENAVLRRHVSRVRYEPDQQRVSVPARDGTTVLIAAGQRLAGAGIALDDLGIRRPSLDDVFLALTGNAGRPGDEPARGHPAGP